MEHIQIPKRKIGESLEITPIVNGLWQVAGGHGKISPVEAQKHASSICNN
jgi:hypothetical protein